MNCYDKEHTIHRTQCGWFILNMERSTIEESMGEDDVWSAKKFKSLRNV